MPARHRIGSGPELSEEEGLVISIESAPAGTASSPEAQVSPYYWRSLTYERYTGRGWSAEYAGKVRYDAGEAAIDATGSQRSWLRANVRCLRDTGELLYLAGAVVTADREFRVAWCSQPSDEQPGDVYGALIEADTYCVDSLLPVVSEADLRAAGLD